MRTKTTTTTDLKPGMVIRCKGVDTLGLDMTRFRQVAKVDKLGIYSSTAITFTDGTRAHVGYFRDFEIAISKRARNTAIRKATNRPTAFDVMAAMFRAYIAA